MANIVTDFIDKITRHKRDRQMQKVGNFRQLAMLIGDAELDGTNIDDINIDLSSLAHFANVMETDGYTEADLRPTVDEYKKFKLASKVASELKKRDAAVRLAEKKWRDADLEEGQRRREALKRLAELHHQLERAVVLRDESTEARSYMIGRAIVTDRERTLIGQQQQLSQKMNDLKYKLNPHAARLIAGASFMVRDNPGALRAECLRDLKTLAEGKHPNPAQKKSDIERTLRIADDACAKVEQELADVEKEYNAVTAELTEIAQSKACRPELFPIVKAKPTFDEQAKQRGIEAGYHDGHTVISTI